MHRLWEWIQIQVSIKDAYRQPYETKGYEVLLLREEV